MIRILHIARISNVVSVMFCKYKTCVFHWKDLKLLFEIPQPTQAQTTIKCTGLPGGKGGGRKQLKLRIDLRISYVMCLMSISLSRCKVKRLLEQMYLSHFIVKSPSVTNLRLTS